MQTTKVEEIRQKMIVTERDLQSWMTRKRVPQKLQEVIIKNIKQKLEDNKDANLENLFAVLPWDTKKALKRHLCLDALQEVYIAQTLCPSLNINIFHLYISINYVN